MFETEDPRVCSLACNGYPTIMAILERGSNFMSLLFGKTYQHSEPNSRRGDRYGAFPIYRWNGEVPEGRERVVVLLRMYKAVDSASA